MKKLINIKAIFAVMCIMSISLMTFPIGSIVEAASASIGIGRPSFNEVKVGETVKYIVSYTDVTNITLNEHNVSLYGFNATISVSGSGLNTRTITLSNISGNIGSGKYISLPAGTANNGCGAVNNTIPFAIVGDDVNPSIGVGRPSTKEVFEGETVSYTVSYSDNIAMGGITLNNSNIRLNGFSANVSITGSGNYSRVITLSNIKGAAGKGKNISIASKTGFDTSMNYVGEVINTIPFAIKVKPVDPTPDPKPQPDKPADWILNPNTGG